ncbi:hypothetical protein TrVE_jg6668 [Triparma verrucosa]|uniref:Ion transport domain-containing protein n=1 Tax=Triparma verrucosa TaxID=1606542 RepID=A0A9W7ELN6_9STRA|nr:hypothetical protein TrVE_jg6668 [Triparma verrucosa]
MTLVYLILHVLETLLSPKSQTFLLTSILKPILIIYSFPISTSTSSTTVYNQSPNLFRIFSLELGLIFCFSLAAVLLYSDDEYFKDLSHSFVTLFALSTTVNNPSSWIALYKRSPFNSLFFITFLTCSLFYVHSIVLGLVLNEYSKGFKTELDKKITNRERAVKMAYECLKRDSGKKNVDNEREDKSYVKRQDLKEALGYLRPHYTQSKLDRICKSYPENISRETFHRVVKKGISMRVTTQGRRRFMMLQKILSCFDENAYLMYVLRVGRETLRATAGPCLLNFMTLHLFNYVGIYLWASKVGDWLNGRGGEYYYLLNFNSYGEGLVTLFNLMVVNDWNQIAKVFTAISKESTTYTFFIAFQLIVSGVMVNVVKGFFVSAFIKNYEDDPSQSSKKKSSVRRSSTSKVAVFESAKREGSLREGNIESPDESEPLLTLAVSKRGGYIDTMENVVGVGVIGGSSAPPICTFNAETNQVLGFNPEFTINCEGINEKKMAGALVEAVVRGKTSWSFFEMGHEFTPIVTTIGGNVKIIILQH